MRTWTALLVLTAAAFAQRHSSPEIDARKPEGALLTQGVEESDPAKKAAILERFCAQFPKSEAMAWTLETLQGIYVRSGQFDKIIGAGERLLALDPADPESALQNLKAAEALKDLAGVRKWSAAASANARRMAASLQPKDAEEVSYAKQVDIYTEYSLFRVAVEYAGRDPKVAVEFAEALEERNPNSQYMAQARMAQFAAYRQSGAGDKAVALAERVLATDQSDENMLMVVADDYASKRKEPGKVHEYTAKAVAAMAAKPAPPGTSEADWDARRNDLTGLAHYLSGKLYYTDKNYAEADRELRAALPLVETNAVKPEVLFMLGFADFSMQKLQDAADFYKACAAVPGTMQAQAAKNLQALKAKYTGIQ